MSAVWTALATLALFAAWALLYAASARVRDGLPPGRMVAPRPALCRSLALVLGLAAFAGCAFTQGPGMGSLLWLSLLCATAFAVVALATWAPHWPAALPGSGGRQGQ